MMSVGKTGSYWDTEISWLKKVGPKRAELLQQEIGVANFRDLLQYVPAKYIDRSRILKVREVTPEDSYISLKGKIYGISMAGAKGPARRLTALFRDETGVMELIWFQGIKYISEQIKEDMEVILHGRPSWFQSRLQMAHPEIEPLSGIAPQGILPFYSTTEKMKKAGMDSRGMRQLVLQLKDNILNNIPENLSAELLKEMQLPGRDQAFYQIHFPDTLAQALNARKRLKFEELFFFQFMLSSQKLLTRPDNKSAPFPKIGELFNRFYAEGLPFTLTEAQKRVLKEIRADLAKPVQMNRLIQGDVGSGKTMVAFLSILIALDNGYQAALMAPTEILADQHYRTISAYAQLLGIQTAILTGKTTAKARKQLIEGLESGAIQILVGTHALLEDYVRFQNLGLTIIDEQHKFGVMQRARLWTKSALYPHNMVMTATPIPRTLALTLYGDLDVSVIDELPPGRKPVRTRVAGSSKRMEVYYFLGEQLRLGRQVYFVYPLIAESEKSDLKAAEEAFVSLAESFPAHRVGLVHGRMKPEEKEWMMQDFKGGKIHILVSTTVIEVGVDVPNASVMVIENAERFGLSQLHQLRGRVGRGASQSYCILMVSEKISRDGRERLKTMEETNDGFKISEVDLKLRGPGDFLGTRQSGLPDFKIANIAEDGELLAQARGLAENIVAYDPELMLPEHAEMKAHYRIYFEANRKFAGIA